MSVDHPLYDAQVALEQEMVAEGAEAYMAASDKAANREAATTVAHGSRLVRQGLGPVIDGLAGWIAEVEGAGRGRHAHSMKYLRLVGVECAALIGVRMMVDKMFRYGGGEHASRGYGGEVPLTGLAMLIGKACAEEHRLAVFEKTNKARYFNDLQKAKANTSPMHRHKIMSRGATKAGVDKLDWSQQDMLHLGTKIVETIASTTGIIELCNVRRGRNRSEWMVKATPEAVAYVGNLMEQYQLCFPRLLPMVIPPKPWSSFTDGGYWTEFGGKPSLVNRARRAYVKMLFEQDLGAVLAAVNRAQETPRRVNLRVLAVAERLFSEGVRVGKMPRSTPIEMPVKPYVMVRDAEQLAEWRKGNKAAYEAWYEEHRATVSAYRREAHARYRAEAKRISRAIQTTRLLKVARRFADYPSIYFPCTLDFRGRMYAAPWGLNPQGNDLAKALLRFADEVGQPITDQNNGMFWLCVHTANCYGYDKASFEDRERWTLDRMAEIKETARNPIEMMDFWTKAGDPWQFLAACFEVAAAEEHGPGYVSTIPVAMDGSCNGLQHYSAMLRDEEGGRMVNLLPSEAPSDIYRRVADVTTRKLREALSGAYDLKLPESALSIRTAHEWAQAWLSFGVSRKITKRSVMTLPYSATMRSCRAFVGDAIAEALAEGCDNPFGYTDEEGNYNDGAAQAASALYQTVWDAINEVVRGAKDAMAFLKDALKVSMAADDVGGVLWKCPDGFLVEQRVPDMERVRVKTRLLGSVVKLDVHRDLIQLDKHAMRNGIAPNFVHSMDGCAQRMFVNLAWENGLRAFSLVHDSFATVAADVDTMQACIRHAFVDMYEENDVLAQFKASIAETLEPEEQDQLPEVPPKGTLDLGQVLDSDFFFS